MSKMTISREARFRVRALIALLVCIVVSKVGFAQQEPIIFEVKKNLALKDSEKILKDYLISQGTEAGLQPGTTVNVLRRVSVYDSYQNRSAGDMLIPIGEVQIIFAQRGIAVARLLSIFDRRNLPGVEFEAVMIGDRIDLRSIKKGKVSNADFDSQQDTLEDRSNVSRSTAAVVAPSNAIEVPAPTTPNPVVNLNTAVPASPRVAAPSDVDVNSQN